MKSLKINALANTILKILNIVFPLITTPYLTRLLDVNDFSNFNDANTYINLFIPLAAFGIYNYGIREISNIKYDKQNVNNVFSKLFYTGITTSVLTYILFILVIQNKNNINYNLYYILGFQVLFQFLYIEWINEALEEYTFILYKTIFIRLTMLASIFIFVTKASDIIPYTIIMTVTTVVNFIISFVWIKSKINLVRIPIIDIFKTIKILLPVFLLANVNMLYTVLDRLFLTYSTTNTYITSYTLAQTLTAVITGVLIGAISVNIPRYGYYIGINKREEYEKLLNKGSRFFMFIIIPISFGFMILGKYIMFVSFGDKYFDSYILTVFGFRTILISIELILGYHIIFTNGFEKTLTKFYFIGGIINLIINSLLYVNDLLNPEYLLIGTIIADSIVILMEIAFIKKNHIIRLKQLMYSVLKYSTISTLFFPIYCFVEKYFQINFILNLDMLMFLTLIIMICSATYFSILFLIKDKSIIYILKFIKAKRG